MIFGDLIREVLNRLDGGIAGVIMGLDGIALEAVSKNGIEVEIQTAGIEYATILKDVRRVSGDLKSGRVSEVSILAEKYTLIIEPITEEYFFALAVSPNGNFGKARYLMKLAVPKIQEAL
jgi:predicted regulator of Ras-like GTPase activity (Roadblock/LC7/MglB family)